MSPTERPMRVAVIVVGLVVVSTPSQASKSCMTQAEARQQFATSHLYWHGRHCWDAMTPSRRVVHRVREIVQEPQRDPAEPNNPEPKWREAMSEMLTANEAPSPSVNWENRWVEIPQAPLRLSRATRPRRRMLQRMPRTGSSRCSRRYTCCSRSSRSCLR